MKKIIHIIFVLVCLYLGYCLPDSLPNEGMFLNSRNPSRGFGNNILKREIFRFYLTLHIFILDKVKHVRKKIPDNLAKENSSLNRIEVEGIVEEIDGSINLKCPICNNIQTCNPSEYLISLLYNTSETL